MEHATLHSLFDVILPREQFVDMDDWVFEWIPVSEVLNDCFQIGAVERVDDLTHSVHRQAGSPSPSRC
jgi:hypothetical protein